MKKKTFMIKTYLFQIGIIFFAKCLNILFEIFLRQASSTREQRELYAGPRSCQCIPVAPPPPGGPRLSARLLSSRPTVAHWSGSLASRLAFSPLDIFLTIAGEMEVEEVEEVEEEVKDWRRQENLKVLLLLK